MIPATLVGSLPKPAWLAEPERLWPAWTRSGPELQNAQRDAVRVAVFEQERAGLDIITDGEQSRRHFVHGFLESIEGIDFGKMVRKGIRDDRYEADLPTVTGAVRRPRPVHVDEVRFLRTLTDRKIKFTLPGPMTIVDTLNDAHYGERKRFAFAIAEILRDEIADLCAAGADVIQLDEPAFNVYLNEVAAWGADAVDVAFERASCTKALHVCYGYGIQANNEWKAKLGPSWDQYGHILPALAKSSIDQIALELAGSHVPPRVFGSIKNKQVAVGVIDVASEAIESPEDVAATLRRALEFVPASRLLASTNCGMAPMKREIAYAKLRAIVSGAALADRRANERFTTEAFAATAPE